MSSRNPAPGAALGTSAASVDPASGALAEPTAPAPSSRTARTALRLAVVALLGAAVGIVIGAAALLGGGQGSCREAAWASVPAAADLPAGWTVGASQVSVDSVTTRLAGPAPADATAEQPIVYSMVSCYGADATAGLDRSRDAARAAGETVVERPDLGDAGFAIESVSSGTTAVFFRRGDLVAYVAPSSTVAAEDLGVVETAVATAADRAVRGVAAPGTAQPPSASPGASAAPTASVGAPTASAAPSESPAAAASPSPSPTAAAPELLALLPDAVAGTALTSDSANGADVLGTDAASRAFVATLRTLGKTTADLQIAQAYDETGSLDVYLLAFRVPGLSGAKLAPVVMSTWLLADSPGVTASTVTLGGKAMTAIDYGDGGSLSYVYPTGEAVVVIQTTDSALAGEVAALLP